MTSRKLVGAALAALASVVVLASCASSDKPSSGHDMSTMNVPAPQQAGHNQADVTFAQGMIQQAQDPEIQQLNGLLKGWGVAPSGEHSEHGSMSGMMTEDDLAKLGQAKNAAFDQQWLEMMVKHHEGALTMAKTVLQQGSNAEVKALAQKVIDGQQAEITEMRTLLG